MAKQRLSRKMFHICIVCVIVITIIFIAGMLVLSYNENGEINMPFQVSKISIISTIDGQDVENSTEKWDINVIQNNDIYVYVESNENYKKQETISNIKLDNFIIKQKPIIGEIKIYKPTINETSLFKNSDENLIESIEFVGTKSTDTRNLEISNQGGVLAYRCSNNSIGTYKSNDDTEINYNNLIQKLNVKESDIKASLTFDMTITLDSGKVFKAESIAIEIPNENVVNEGTKGQEYTNLQDDIIFKRK